MSPSSRWVAYLESRCRDPCHPSISHPTIFDLVCSLHIDLTPAASFPVLVSIDNSCLAFRLAVRLCLQRSLVGDDWINIICPPSRLPIHFLLQQPTFLLLIVCSSDAASCLESSRLPARQDTNNLHRRPRASFWSWKLGLRFLSSLLPRLRH